jgi:predicted GIY-YIG superfamily endonuclease/predicted RNA-binding Zn-ribbon protein involved in translation (DUF1610 family)
VCKKITTATVSNRTKAWDKGTTGCVAIGCKGRGSIAQEYPDHVGECIGWNPEKVSAKSRKKMAFRCPQCGEVTEARVDSRTNAWDREVTGCPCSKHGYNPFLMGWLYLIRNSAAGILQIGITNRWDQRLKDHRKNGFEEVLDIIKYNNGALAKDWESSIKKLLVNRLEHPLETRIYGVPFDGYTESWMEDELPVTKLSDLQDMVHATESVSV